MKKTSVKIGGRLVPLTKSGLPNKVYLSKDEKKVFDEFIKKKKKDKLELSTKDLLSILSK